MIQNIGYLGFTFPGVGLQINLYMCTYFNFPYGPKSMRILHAVDDIIIYCGVALASDI